MTMFKCPECKGQGESRGFGCPGFRPITIPCHLCKGAKEITEERLQWVLDGEALRQDRRRRGISVREEAKRRGIKPVDYSQMEFGVQRPVHDSSESPKGVK